MAETGGWWPRGGPGADGEDGADGTRASRGPVKSSVDSADVDGGAAVFCPGEKTTVGGGASGARLLQILNVRVLPGTCCSRLRLHLLLIDAMADTCSSGTSLWFIRPISM